MAVLVTAIYAFLHDKKDADGRESLPWLQDRQ
jgi:hypothetical protein